MNKTTHLREQGSSTFLSLSVWWLLNIIFVLVMLTFSLSANQPDLLKSLVLVGGSGLVGCLAISERSVRERLLAISFIHYPFLLYFGIQIGSLSCSEYPLLTLSYLVTTIPLLILVMIVARSQVGLERLRFFVMVIYLVSGLTGLYGIGQHYGLDPVPWLGFEGRIFSTFGHPNFYASWLIFSIPVLLFSQLGQPSVFMRVSGTALLFLSFWCLMLTRCRSALLSLIIVFMPFVFFKKTYRFLKNGVWPVILILLTIGIVGGMFIMHTDLVTRICALRDANETSIKSRVLIYQSLVPALMEKPVLGFGTGTFSAVFPQYHLAELYRVPPFTTMTMLKHAHSEYLELLVENGLTGLLAFLACLAALLYGFRRIVRQDIDQGYFPILGIMIGLGAILVQNWVSVSFRFLSTQTIFWFGCALIIAYADTVTSPKQPVVSGKVQTILTMCVFLIMIGSIVVYSIPGIVSRYRADILLKTARGLIEQHEYEQADEILHRAVRINANDIDILSASGAVALHMNRLESARDFFHAVLSINPHYPLTHYSLAQVEYRENNLDRAKQLLVEADKWRPFSGHIKELLGRIYLQERQVGEAESALRQAAELAPDNPDIFILLGNLFMELQDYHQALHYYRQSIEIEPDQIAIWGNIKQAQQDLGQKKAARIPLHGDMFPSKSVAFHITAFCAEQNMYDVLSPSLHTIETIGQSFSTECDAFDRFSVQIATRYQRVSFSLTARLYIMEGQEESLLQTVRQTFERIGDADWLTVRFDRVNNARGNRYLVVLSLSGPPPEHRTHFWLSMKDRYPQGGLRLNELSVESDLRFRVQ
ncbi:tetratricopeptide repeat protein [bacterium]|nr:tetratricopeptide repeat protein [bacterium]